MTRVWPYEYTDAVTGTTSLWIAPGESPGTATVKVTGGAFVSVAGPAPVAAALYEAAGKPAPVILERPEHPRASMEFCGVTYSLQGGRILADRKPGPHYGGELRIPADIRRAAGRLAALADEAEPDEPDPAEAEELAAVIRAAHHPDSGRPSEGDRTAARAALLWIRDRQQRGETP